jgi:hypothetical protein
MYFKCVAWNNSTCYQRHYFNVCHSCHVTGHDVAQGHQYFPATSHLSRFSESSCYVTSLCKQIWFTNYSSPISNSVESDNSLRIAVTGRSDLRRSIATRNFNFSLGKENIIIITIIIIYLTANVLSSGGSGYNAGSWTWNKDLRNLSREGYMRSMQ